MIEQNLTSRMKLSINRLKRKAVYPLPLKQRFKKTQKRCLTGGSTHS